MAKRARLGRSSRRQRGRDTGKTLIGIALIVIVLTIMGGGGLLYLRATESKVELDKATLCPVSDGQTRPAGYAAILIDTSDELPAIQRTNAANELTDVVNRVPQGWRLSIYQLSTDVARLPEPTIVLCNPGSGEELDRISGNPEMARRRWLKEFVEPMEAVVTNAVSSGEAASSPIMETIAGIAATDLATPTARQAPRRLIILSDMLQHSAIASHYRAQPVFEKFKRESNYNRVRIDLTGTEVTIFYIDRARSAGISWDQHVSFWEQFFNAQGATLERVRRILG